MKNKPNIVFFVPDSYRGDVLGHQGNQGALTPNIDELVASDAVSYSNTFAQSPVCTPSRCSFMTGLYPHTHGHRSMQNMLKEHEPSLLSVLRKEGYLTWWGGRNDFTSVTEWNDYLKYCDIKFQPEGKFLDDMEYKKTKKIEDDDPLRWVFYGGVLHREGDCDKYWDKDMACVLGAVNMIRNYSDNKPFFCYLPIAAPHPAYLAEEDFYNAIDPDQLPPRIPTPSEEAELPDILDSLRHAYGSSNISEEMWKEIKRIYYAMCSKVDDLFGKVIDALKEQGVYDNTWVFFFSDHGDFTGDYSLPEKTHATLQDCLLHVPLIIKPPVDVPSKPGRREHLTELLDITATLYDLLDIDPEYDYQGSSLRSSLAGEETTIHDAVFAEVGSRKNEKGFVNRAVEQLPKNNFYFRQGSVAIPYHEAGSLAVMCRTERFKYIRRFYSGHHELFDLQKDFAEMVNLSGNPEYADIESQMEINLLDFFMKTSDTSPHSKDSRGI